MVMLLLNILSSLFGRSALSNCGHVFCRLWQSHHIVCFRSRHAYIIIAMVKPWRHHLMYTLYYTLKQNWIFIQFMYFALSFLSFCFVFHYSFFKKVVYWMWKVVHKMHIKLLALTLIYTTGTNSATQSYTLCYARQSKPCAHLKQHSFHIYIYIPVGCVCICKAFVYTAHKWVSKLLMSSLSSSSSSSLPPQCNKRLQSECTYWESTKCLTFSE